MCAPAAPTAQRWAMSSHVSLCSSVYQQFTAASGQVARPGWCNGGGDDQVSRELALVCVDRLKGQNVVGIWGSRRTSPQQGCFTLENEDPSGHSNAANRGDRDATHLSTGREPKQAIPSKPPD
ncbi:hypothetical protein K469DRAFT_691891 [Zopfia rhizophila CBS 207.26]|uniref:Uncharacterized protein n=1 Tax=Zopfia rhizophila CBS 207.26 TaxID=1314779 RepID=A0A6A6DQF4_9PEZI|nr:hypothetical protein K469DRAFT_691891 [Zopfia rhizophila CBS 207.26]